MDNPDILQLILLKSDDKTLSKLILTSLWPSVRASLLDPHFWYLRTEVIAGMPLKPRPITDWKKIYYLIKANGVGIIDDLPTAEVITEVFGSGFWRKLGSREEADRGIASVQVMKYLLDNKYVKLSYVLLDTMYLAGARDLRDLVDYLLKLNEDEEVEEVHYVLMHGLSGAIFGDNLGMYKYLEGLIIDDLDEEDLDNREILDDLVRVGGPNIIRYFVGEDAGYEGITETLISSAIERRRPDVLASILEVFNPGWLGHQVLVSTWEDITQAIEEGNEDVIKVVLEHTTIEPEQLLERGITRRKDKLVKHALTLVEDPSYYRNNALTRAVMEGNLGAIQLLLQDSRLDPNINVKEIVRLSSKHQDGMLSLDLIVRDSRLDLGQLKLNTVRLIISVILKLINPAVEGFNYGNSLAGEEPIDLLYLVEQKSDSIDSALLKLLVIKRPSGRDIFAWLATSNRPEIVLEAARSIQNKNLKCSSKAITVRELMLAIIYPTMTLQEVISVLKSEGVTRETIILACRLVGTYIGYRNHVKT